MSNSSIRPIDRTLGLSGPGSNDNKEVLSIPGTSPSDCLMPYPGHSFGVSYPLCRYTLGVFYSRPLLPTWKEY